MFLALAACGGSESNGNTGGSGPSTEQPDVRDAAGGGANPDVIERDAGIKDDAPGTGIADSAAIDANGRDTSADAPTNGGNDVNGRDTATEASSPVDAGGPPDYDVGACVPTVSTARRLRPALYLMVESSTSMDTVDM